MERSLWPSKSKVKQQILITVYYISLVKTVRSQQLQSLRAQSIQNPDNVSFALLNNSHIWTEKTESVKTESQVLAHLHRYLLELHHFFCTMTALSVWEFKSQSRNRTWQAKKNPEDLLQNLEGLAEFYSAKTNWRCQMMYLYETVCFVTWTYMDKHLAWSARSKYEGGRTAVCAIHLVTNQKKIAIYISSDTSFASS